MMVTHYILNRTTLHRADLQTVSYQGMGNLISWHGLSAHQQTCSIKISPYQFIGILNPILSPNPLEMLTREQIIKGTLS
jgi:hypothetical protein